MREQAKGAERLGPKGDGARKGPRTATPRGRKRHPVDSRHLPPRGLLERNVETSYLRLTERRARSFLPGTEPFSSCRPGSFRPAPCPIFSPLFGGQSRSGTVAIASRQAYRKGRPRRCGTGCWKKPRPVCNEPDTGQACPARKEPTSSRCFAARRQGEPPSRGKAIGGRSRCGDCLRTLSSAQ